MADFTDSYTAPTRDQLKELWNKIDPSPAPGYRNHGLYVSGCIPIDREIVADEFRVINWGAILLSPRLKNPVAEGWTAFEGYVTGFGSKICLHDKKSDSLIEDIHPSWVYSAGLAPIRETANAD